MGRFALTVAAVVLFASVASSANAAVHQTRVTANGVVQKSISTTPAGKPKVTKTLVAPNGATLSQKVVHGPNHTHVKMTFTRPNGNSKTVRIRK